MKRGRKKLILVDLKGIVTIRITEHIRLVTVNTETLVLETVTKVIAVMERN